DASARALIAEIAVMEGRIEARAPDGSTRHRTPYVMTLHDRRWGDSRKPVLLLLATVGLLLLIACANVANLSLARAERRKREFGMRLAIGASHGRLVRLVLGESLVLSLAGALAGWALSGATIGVFVRMAPAPINGLENLHADPLVLAFTLSAAVLSAIAFGL